MAELRQLLDQIARASTLYEVLGLEAASFEEAQKYITAGAIRGAYLRRALILHPDKQSLVSGADASGSAGAHAADPAADPRLAASYLRLREAYDTLSTAASRAQYDHNLWPPSSLLVDDEFSLEDMLFDEDDNMYTLPCRCSGVYRLHVDEIDSLYAESQGAGFSNVLFCQQCSLKIRIQCSGIGTDSEEA
ncbi:hypothetical protein H696_03546 [Fonticula alba]|uniref:Diphthamide biosynthesis protein 4 n=1 Tax=Fonticula alba TaxID=691883 RepID=A0A058Z724_FONAL|nr:hypothetical protein H696_03546 [Fonticula alba]KCV70084.1 hypothetical protein H696_03546 [Fonticula alba]|eukprot:XP_009495690.1 hypothetical protein H696_03546 [Fonticula alba]